MSSTEPFYLIESKSIPFIGNQNYTLVLDENLAYKLIPNFRASRFPSCYWEFSRDYIKGAAKKIEDQLQVIFDKGSKKHFEEYVLNQGAKRVTDQENTLKIMHKDGLFTISGSRDVLEHDFEGEFIRDFKTTSHETHKPESANFMSKINWKDGFVWYLIEGVNEDYIIQMSVYSYMHYIETGDRVERVVITKLDKVQPRNRLSLEGNLKTVEETRMLILKHPVIHFVLGKIDESVLIRKCIAQMRKFVREKAGKKTCWKCGNCQYRSGCKVNQAITR